MTDLDKHLIKQMPRRIREGWGRDEFGRVIFWIIVIVIAISGPGGP